MIVLYRMNNPLPPPPPPPAPSGLNTPPVPIPPQTGNRNEQHDEEKSLSTKCYETKLISEKEAVSQLETACRFELEHLLRRSSRHSVGSLEESDETGGEEAVGILAVMKPLVEPMLQHGPV
jgi:hypothetical protein